MRQIISTALVAVVVSLVTVTAVGALAQDAPATQQAVVPSVTSINAHKVDGRHAVSASASRAKRAGKLVATNRQGYLPNNIIKPAWKLIGGKPAAFADGKISWGEVQGVPGSFADGVDNKGITSIKVTRVFSDAADISPGTEHFADAFCPAGSVVVGGGGAGSNRFVHLTTSFPGSATSWRSHAENLSDSTASITVWAVCMSVEPSGAISTASKGRLSPAGARGKGR